MPNPLKNRGGLSVRSLTAAAMLTAMSVVIGIFCKTVLNFGGGLFRITFENLPILLTGLLYGPFVGGMVGICSDLASYLLSAQTYPPNLIVTAGAALVGILSGTCGRLLRDRSVQTRVITACAVSHLVGSMVVKSVGLYQFYGAMVLWRIPVYLVIATLETTVLCLLLGRESFRKLTKYK